MTNDVTFNEEAQRDLLAAAARLYEAELYDLCMGLLLILIRHGNKEAHILYGNCISFKDYEFSDHIASMHYKIAGEMGSALGYYNLSLNYEKTDKASADYYLSKAVELGWEDFD